MPELEEKNPKIRILPARLSIATTAFNEADNLRAFCASIRDSLKSINIEIEIIIVDNGSVDDTLEILRELSLIDKSVRYVSLTRNFGHQGGLIAAMSATRGQIVVTMDADLQHPPSEIPKMLELWQRGFDIVNTKKRETARRGSGRKILDKAYYRILSQMCQIPVSESQSDFRLLDRKALDALMALPEKEKFLRGLVHWIGYSSTNIEYVVNKRHTGQTKFNLRQLWSFGINGIVSFSLVPLRLFTLIGLTISVASLSYAIYLLVWWWTGLITNVPPGWVTLATALLFFGGFLLSAIGVLGEYVGKILDEVRARPAYIVREKSNDEDLV